ncbi:MAG: CDP-alcohol phosphatidyltransferase family protein [Anaerolineae bacterium]|jgi:CDP-L-myo-inositol myo-inositolphosphotransferase|nr:CDP-alcohol phosphatidyltransferase family protein [Anaerolineae bacterium]MDH7474967.1 CDP-alcohol phosphatidyltransferase family protein [Anaerolineae bacterium]
MERKTGHDGLISRHLNRKISRLITRFLVPTGITPNQVTFISFFIALLSSATFTVGFNVLGGLLAQLSSIVDGVDGEIARLKGLASPFGAFYDAVLDRYADAAIILGMILWTLRFEGQPATWLFGLLALLGSLMISYSAARSEASTGMRFDHGFSSFLARDIRLFIIMLGSLVGQVYWTLVFLAVLTNAVVIYRVFFLRSELR